MGASQGPDSGRHRHDSPGVDGVDRCVAHAQTLARTPSGERDLAWHVAAFYVGDLSALVTARLREPARTG